ncbi:hypothetical protein KI387_015533 [Taxus chinensis]|uniref:Uncharacterized protein n=1 Tax=Taxus chinensis TaxID=29808 RepID=A0AA38GG50_TAXCH|nr:hypothetical protein KI387_015533 [Taxus chinensis]
MRTHQLQNNLPQFDLMGLKLYCSPSLLASDTATADHDPAGISNVFTVMNILINGGKVEENGKKKMVPCVELPNPRVLRFCFSVVNYQQMDNHEISISSTFDSSAIFDKFYGGPYSWSAEVFAT